MKQFIIASSILLASSLHAGAEAKYVFYFIGDGMGMGHVNTTETYNREILKNDTPLLMLTFPVASQARTYSASHPITDSAAAGTALSTGSKTVNSRVSMAPDSTDLYSISRDFMQAGRSVGVATSVAGDDATPAAFYAHALNRHSKLDIAPYAVESGVSFLAGGNFKIMSDNKKGKKWLDDMQKRGHYTVVRGIDEYNAKVKGSLTRAASKGEPGKVLMLSQNPVYDQIGYTIDSIPGALTLPQITEACLETVAAADKGNGFFMMVEGGNIDWAAHANDGGSVIKEILNFQEAIQVAYDFYLKHPDETLIVITADHDTGGMALGRVDNQKHPDLALVDFQKISKDSFTNMLRQMIADGKTPTWEELRKILNSSLGFWDEVRLTTDEEIELQSLYDSTFVKHDAVGEKTIYQDYDAFTGGVFNILNRHLGIGWTSTYHTANFVPVYAIGEGSELFTGCLNNVEIPMLIRRAALGE